MPKITYHDLQYQRELDFREKINSDLKRFKNAYPDYEQQISKELSDFYFLLSNGIRLDDHPTVDLIAKEIQRKYNVDFPIKIFLYENAIPKVMCTPRVYFEDGVENTELIILISQHFINYLEFQEQIAILAHETCHLILRHTDIPSNYLLHRDVNFHEFKQLKVNLLKWSVCAEISSDMFALYANDFNPKIFCSAIIKFISGIYALDSFDIIALLTKQYDDLANNINTTDLTPHPITPLRIKIINELSSDELVKKMGQEVEEDEYIRLKENYTQKIDSLVEKVYPELTNRSLVMENDLKLKLGVAVALADRKITEEEIDLLKSLVDTHTHPNDFIAQIIAALDKYSHEEVIEQLIEDCVKFCVENGYTKSDLLPLIRFMLFVSIADQVEINELRVVNRFAEQFHISREEIVILLHQMF